MHKRSRSGCFTCRLRRKKCDESRPVCRACKHLGVDCEYKRPAWWQSPERRKQHKELIKDIIRNTKMNERPSSAAVAPPPAAPVSINSPPSLCHSMPNSDTRAASVDSHFSPQFDIETPRDMFNSTPMMPPPQWTPSFYSSPYEVEIKTESHMLVNDVPTHKDSVISTFTAFQPPSASLPPSSADWNAQEFWDSGNESMPATEEPLDFSFFDFAHAPLSPQHQTVVSVDDADKYLLDHFLDKVSRLVFPIMDVNQHGSACSDVILPALENNKCYLHSCLSTAAVHLKATGAMEGEQIDTDIMRHRYATISALCEAFDRDGDHVQNLEATLGLILFQSSVGSPDDGLPDIPWHQHFQAAQTLLEKLGIMQAGPSQQQVPFNATLSAWIDILGATMLCRVPAFADSYREKIEAEQASGLAELMGCDDRIMYLISEIVCLDSLKHEGQVDDLMLCNHIQGLGNALSATEAGPNEVAPVTTSTGALRPKQLARNITAAFRLAARIYLCSLVPEFDRRTASVMSLVRAVNDVWQKTPTGPEGFDRCLVWPLLVAGSVSSEGSEFRKTMAERTAAMGSTATMGSFGRMREVLEAVWEYNDKLDRSGSDGQRVHWRDMMRHKGWDCLLI